ncbi:MAG TPA: GNAT family N-acetyltransferase [Chloroflexota bacterium]
MQVAFRPARHDDLDTLIAFRRELCASDPIPFDDVRARAAIVNLIRDPAWGRIWLLLDGEAPIGFVALCLGYSLEYYGREAIVDELFIGASHRGQGIGRRAMAHVETEARALGVHALHLVVETWNVPALELYRRVGYQAHDRYLMTKWLVSVRSPG